MPTNTQLDTDVTIAAADQPVLWMQQPLLPEFAGAEEDVPDAE